jgi:hypothetical protein
LTDIVIAGGWAHRLHTLHPSAQKLGHDPLMTVDADIALSDRLPIRDVPIGTLLENDFETEFSFDEPHPDDDGPPVCRYVPRGVSTEFYLEFIAPLRGSAAKQGALDATVDVAGVSAQKLRHVDLLLRRPLPSLQRRSRALVGSIVIGAIMVVCLVIGSSHF